MTRHELKDQLQHDQFTDAVSGAVSYASIHRQGLIRYGIAALAILVIGGGVWWYMATQADTRRTELAGVLSIADAPVGAAAADSTLKSYPTEDAKRDALVNALNGFVSKYSGSSEGYIAQYYRGTAKAQKDDLSGAESDLRAVADSSSDMAPLAKMALANVYLSEKKNVDAQSLLQSLAKDGSPLVSRAQGQIFEAQSNAASNPQAAKDVLKTMDAEDKKREAVSRAAETVSTEIAK